MTPDWYFYLVRCRDDSLYAGITNDLTNRLKAHNTGRGAKYTAAHLPVKLVYSEKFDSMTLAKKREAGVKRWPKSRKEKLVRGETRPNRKAPGVWTVEGQFEGQPGSLILFEAVRDYIESLGPVTVEPAKTQISFGVKRKFAWVWLPQMWIKKRPLNTITLALDLDHEVKDRRIVQAVEPRPGRWTHHILINEESDLDKKVKGWVREAYANGATDRRRQKATQIPPR